MLHCKHKQHRHRRSQKFFHWSAKSTFCLPISGCWRWNSNGGSHHAFPFYTTKKMTHVMATAPKMRFVDSNISFHIVKSMWLTAISSHCLAALPATDVFSNHMRLNTYYRNLKWTFVAMLLLRNESQFQNYPHPSFATCLCRQCSGLEWTASSKVHDTTTVNPALAQCECHIGKLSYRKTVVARITSIKLELQVFYQFLVLILNFQVVANSHFVPTADTHEHRGMPNTETSHQLYLLSLIIK